jgi:hypothetical protein
MDFKPYGIMFMNIVLLQQTANIVMFWKCGVYGIVFIDGFFITAPMVMLLTDFGIVE